VIHLTISRIVVRTRPIFITVASCHQATAGTSKHAAYVAATTTQPTSRKPVVCDETGSGHAAFKPSYASPPATKIVKD